MSVWNCDYTEWPKSKESDCVVFKDSNNHMLSFNMTCSKQLIGDEIMDYLKAIKHTREPSGQKPMSGNGRYIAVYDGTCCTDDFYVIYTDAPAERLKELEALCLEIADSGGSEEIVPDWFDLLTAEGFSFDYIDACDNPYAKEWLDSEYPDVTEIYTKHYPVPPEGKTFGISQC